MQVSGGTSTDTCSLNVSPQIENLLEGSVASIFSAALTPTVCHFNTKEGEASWRGELKLSPTSGAIRAK